MYTAASDAAAESPTAYEWRVWGSDSSATSSQVRIDGASDVSKATASGTVRSLASLWTDSRDGHAVSSAAVGALKTSSIPPTSDESEQLSSSVSPRSSAAMIHTSTVPSKTSYQGPRFFTGSAQPATLAVRSTNDKSVAFQQLSNTSAGVSTHRKRPHGGVSAATLKYSVASLATESQDSEMATAPHDCDDGDDDTLNIIKESIKRQLVGIEEDERVSETTPRGLTHALQESFHHLPRPQQRSHLAVSLPGGAVREATGASRTGGDAPIVQISTAAAPPAPRSAAAAAASPQGDGCRIRCSSSASALEQPTAIRVGQSCVPMSGLSVASGGSNGTSNFHSQMSSSLALSHLAQVPYQRTAQLTTQQPPRQNHQLQQQQQQQTVVSALCQPYAAASRATMFEQQRQPPGTVVGGTASDASTGANMSIRTGGLRVSLPTTAPRAMNDNRCSGEVVQSSVSAETARRACLHKDPSRGAGAGSVVAATAALTTPPAVTLSSASSAPQSGCVFSERSSSSSSPGEDGVNAALHHQHSNHQHWPPHQFQPGFSAAHASFRQDHQPGVATVHLDNSAKTHAMAKHEEERLQYDGAPHPPAPAPAQSQLLSQQLQRVQDPSLMSFQAGPRFPNLPPHLQPQPLAQASQLSHSQRPQPQSQQTQQHQKIGGSASSSSGAMMPGKMYASTPHGRLISLTPDGVRVAQVEQPQNALPPPPPPPPPPSTATSSALSGNYITASNYSTLFCRNNPLHSMRYPGSESHNATRLVEEADSTDVDRASAAATGVNTKRLSSQSSNTNASALESGGGVSSFLGAAKAHGEAEAIFTDTRVTVSSSGTNPSTPGVDTQPLPIGRAASAAGGSASARSAVGVDPSKCSSVAVSVSCDSQSPTTSVASAFVRGSNCSSSFGKHGQYFGTQPSISSVAGGSCPPYIPMFPPRDDNRSTPCTGSAYHATLSHTPLSASTSNSTMMSSSLVVKPTATELDRYAAMSTPNMLVVPSMSPAAGGCNLQMAVNGNGSDKGSVHSGTGVASGQKSAAATKQMGQNNNALGNTGSLMQLTTGLMPSDSGFVSDVAGTAASGHATRFAHVTPHPTFSASACPAPYGPGAALCSVNGNGGSTYGSTHAPLPTQTAGGNCSVSRTDLYAPTASPMWTDAVASPVRHGPLGPPPPPVQQSPQLHVQGRSSLPPTPHSSLGGCPGTGADTSVMATVPIRNTDGTLTAVYLTVPPPFSHSDAGVQLYCHTALHQRRPPTQPSPPSLKQPHHHHQGTPTEKQPGEVSTDDEMWRRRQQHQGMATLQLEHHRQRLESELRQVQLQQAQQQQQQHQQYAQPHPHQSSLQPLSSSSTLVQPAMVTIDGRMYSIVSAPSGEVFINNGQSSRDLHLGDGDVAVGDGATAAEGCGQIASPQFRNHPGGNVPISLRSLLPPPPPPSPQQQQQQQRVFIPIAADRGALSEVNACAPGGVTHIAKSSPSGPNVSHMMMTTPALHTLMSQSRSRSGSQSGTATGSDSGSASGSRSGSRSSSNSMRLPGPTAAPAAVSDAAFASAAVAAPVDDAGQPQAQEKEVASIFIGMGPAGRTVTLSELTDYLKSKAIDPANVKDVRLRGRCAFADTTTVEEARHLIAELDNHDYKGKFRLAVQMSKQTMAEAKENKRKRQEVRAVKPVDESRYVNEGRQVFVNLGPAGKEIPNDVIRGKIEAICPVLRFERRGYCLYADVPSAEDTKRVVAALNNMMIDDVRVLVQISTMVRKRERSPPRVRDVARRGGDRHDRDSHRHRHRSDSREVRRRHRRSRRSYTPSSRSSSSYSSRSRSRSPAHSRGRRSYSPDSVDSRDHRSRRSHHGGDRRRGVRTERVVDRRERRGGDRRPRR